jgi:hypothetical protein
VKRRAADVDVAVPVELTDYPRWCAAGWCAGSCAARRQTVPWELLLRCVIRDAKSASTS